MTIKGHGGNRAGAGRKRGSGSKKTRDIAKKAAENGITPLEVMLEAMQKTYQADGAVAAFALAKDAAPYMHPKMQAVVGANGETLPVSPVVIYIPDNGRD